MNDRSIFPPPTNPLLRWIGAIGDDLPEEAQRQLRATMFGAKMPLVIGSLNSIAVAAVAWFYFSDPIFGCILAADSLLLAFRLKRCAQIRASVGPLFLGGLLWAALHGTTIFLVVLTTDLAMTLVALGSGLGLIGGIIGRNFPAPRYALAQAIIIDLSFKVAFCWHFPHFIPLILFQTAGFTMANLGTIAQLRRSTIRAVTNAIESREQSVTDPLTELGNRRGLEADFAKLGSGRATLFYLDLDGFKQVNDQFGHAGGDALLGQVAERLRAAMAPDCRAYRLGGDEFVVLARRMPAEEVRSFGARMIAAIATPYPIDDGLLARVGASIGAASSGPDEADLADLMRNADRALYTVKASGKGACLLYRPSLPGQAPSDNTSATARPCPGAAFSRHYG